MTDPKQQEPSGRDLARQALDEYKKSTWAIPGRPPTPTKKKPKRFVRTGDRRDPVPLVSAMKGLSTDPDWAAGVAGGGVINQWAELCPQYAGVVQPVSYDEKSGRLDLRPGSHSYAAQLRLLGGQLAKQINDKLGSPVVRTIRVLPVGNVQTAPVVEPARQEPKTPVKTRETASPGYRAALEAALAHKPERQPTNPYVTEADERQVAALRAGRQSDTEHREAVWEELDATSGPAPGSVEASRRAALAYKRQDKTGSQTPRRAFDVA